MGVISPVPYMTNQVWAEKHFIGDGKKHIQIDTFEEEFEYESKPIWEPQTIAQSYVFEEEEEED